MLFVSADKGLDLNKTGFRRPDLEIFVRDVRDKQARKRKIVVRSWSTIKDVKDAIQRVMHVPSGRQRLYFGPLLTSGSQLPNHRSLHDVGIYKSGETLLLDIQGGTAFPSPLGSSSSPSNDRLELTHDVCASSSVAEHAPKRLRHLIHQARRGFALGLKPDFILDGSGGSYFLHDARKVKVAVYKPADEEPYAENNPRGYLQQPGQSLSLREGVIPGEACIREVAAYMLDHEGFSGVPMTTLAEARHPTFNTNGARLKVAEGGASVGSHSLATLQSPSSSYSMNSPSLSLSSSLSPSVSSLQTKIGSFQEFVHSECTMDDLSPSKILKDEIHKIAILDIRIMNADRNSANLLCRRRPDKSIELVPIDHGFCLRSCADVSWMDWCWLDWPQLKEPISERCKRYILNLDVEADIRMLKERLNICQEALDIYRASTSILQAGVKAGLALYDIAVMCCRNDNMGETPSKLEALFSMASELATSAVKNGRWNHETASRALADELSPMGGSLFGPTAERASSMRKSLSSLHLSSVDSSGSEINYVPQKDLPEMVKSTASDSSSDTVDDDQDHGFGAFVDDGDGIDSATGDHEASIGGDYVVKYDEDGCILGCGEWAAALVADVSEEKSKRLIQRKQRSASIESEGSSASGSSGSPPGFWYRAPGSDDSSFDGMDDESIVWSPGTSPVSDRHMKSFLYGKGLSLLTLNGDPAHPTKSDGSSCPGPLIPPTMPSISFAGSNIKTGGTASASSSTPNSTKLPGGKAVSFDVAPKSFLSPLLTRSDQQHQIMSRSKSFSALTSSTPVEIKPTPPTTSKQPRGSLVEDSRQFRDYFLKFIDLVIVREMTAASRLSKGIL